MFLISKKKTITLAKTNEVIRSSFENENSYLILIKDKKIDINKENVEKYCSKELSENSIDDVNNYIAENKESILIGNEYTYDTNGKQTKKEQICYLYYE